MPYAKDLENDVVIMDTSASDNFIPDIMKEAVDLLALIRSGAEKNADDIRVGMPHMIQKLRLYKAAFKDVSKLRASISINGNTVEFSDENGEQVYSMYQLAAAEASRKYRESPQGIRDEADRVAKRRLNQQTVNEQLHELELIATSIFPAQKEKTGDNQPTGDVAIRVFKCLRLLVDAGDLNGVEYDRMHIINLLRMCGYVKSEFTELTTGIVPFDMASWRAYIAGQIISCLMPENMGLLPPLASHKIEKHGLDTDTFLPEQAYRGSYGKG